MIKKLKKLFLISILLLGLLFLFGPGDMPDNSEFKRTLDLISQEKILIIFNSGGWGDTPLEQAEDFRPIVKGIQSTLDQMGYDSIVVPYERTKESFLGRIEGVRETLNSFKKQSKELAQEIEALIEKSPETKVIITGLSNGGTFVNRVMGKISRDKRVNVFAIEAGTPFWEKDLNLDNILLLNNKGKDPLSERGLTSLLFSFLKTPFKWVLAKASNNDISFSQALHIADHDYFWEEVAPEVTSFLEEKFVLF